MYQPTAAAGGFPVTVRPSEIATDSSDSKIAWTVFRTPLPSDISQGNFAQSSRAKIVE